MRLLRDLLNALYTEQAACIFCGSERDLATPYLCSHCQKRVDTPPPSRLDGLALISAVYYTRRSRRPVLDLKFHGASWAAKPMARYIADAAKDMDADWVTNVPLHAKRLKRRGYDQAELIARELAEITGLPYESALYRVRATKQQSRLSEKRRADNVKGVFDLAVPVEGLRLLLVDDVITTGATILEAAAVLLEGGAKEVTLVSFGQTPHR